MGSAWMWLLHDWGTWALGLIGTILTHVIVRRYCTSIRDIPGPMLASFSNLWQVLHILKGHTEVETLKLHQKHGYFVRIGSNEVSVSHPDAIRKLLYAQIAKGPWYSIMSIPDYRYVNQMSELDPQQHIRKQRNISSGYALSNIVQHEPHFDAVLQLLTIRLDEFCQSCRPVELDRWFTFFAFDAIGEVIFSKSFGFLEQGQDVRSAIANQRLLAPYVAIMGHYAWLHNLTLGNPLLSRLGIQPSSHIFDTCIAAIDARKQNPAKRHDMMQKWLDTHAKYPDRMEEVEIFSTAVGTLGAGGDTVSATIQALFYLLIRHPQYMVRLQTELDGAEARGELSPIVQYAEAQRLPFLQACMKETYRFHTAVGLALPRVAPPEGITIAGRVLLLPLNSMIVSFPLFCLNFLSCKFFKNPYLYLTMTMSRRTPRRLLPAKEETDTQCRVHNLPREKRRNVSIACTSCRQKKTKCSGMISYLQCTTNGTQCIYDAKSDRRCKANTTELLVSRAALCQFVAKIRHGVFIEVLNLMREIRKQPTDQQAVEYLVQVLNK
ncbi:hypothetical protein N7478_001421 [Penicillium angulare]|uniref:uncharacterized protein n=1 Tax=Penicillium angulare TaxID=116970 RepID=UPI00254078B7|nr:uncharacterized protein N7478_001421 [Penicillium angulare]KAJ5292170.1 hypothetical protein N7478_001421 [Penicillium angulare]